MNLTTIFEVLTVIIGGACVLLLVSTKTLRDSRDDQEKRIAFLEAKSKRDDETIAGQSVQIDALGKVVTGEAHLVAIFDLITEHHDEARTNWSTVGATLAHIDVTMTDLVAVLNQERRRQ